jgi:uncharacterized membrane protein YgdD (TMEM256/DUF423 family)
MIRWWLLAAGLGGLISVAAGAMAAHLAAGDAAEAALLRTGALYGMVHAVLLVGIAVLAERNDRPDLPLRIAGWSIAAGIFLCSFSLFGLALSGQRGLALVTPFGGVALLTGWGALGLHAWRRR